MLIPWTVSQSPCTTLMTGNLPAIRAVQGNFQWLLENDGNCHWSHEATIHCSLPRIHCRWGFPQSIFIIYIFIIYTCRLKATSYTQPTRLGLYGGLDVNPMAFHRDPCYPPVQSLVSLLDVSSLNRLCGCCWGSHTPGPMEQLTIILWRKSLNNLSYILGMKQIFCS